MANENKYLDHAGVTTLWDNIKKKVENLENNSIHTNEGIVDGALRVEGTLYAGNIDGTADNANKLGGTAAASYALKSGTVSNVAYDATNKKITKTINGTTSDVVTASTLKTDMSLNNVGNYKAVSVSASQGLTSTEITNAVNNLKLGNSKIRSATCYSGGDHNSGYYLLATWKGGNGSGNHDASIAGRVYSDGAVLTHFHAYARASGATINESRLRVSRSCNLVATYAVDSTEKTNQIIIRLYAKVTSNWQRLSLDVLYVTNGDMYSRSDLASTDLTMSSTYTASLTGTQMSVSTLCTDTMNTAGSTNSTSKLYLVGATAQAANPQTYSDVNTYVTNGTLHTNAMQLGSTSMKDTALTIEHSQSVGTVELSSTNPKILFKNVNGSTPTSGIIGYTYYNSPSADGSSIPGAGKANAWFYINGTDNGGPVGLYSKVIAANSAYITISDGTYANHVSFAGTDISKVVTTGTSTSRSSTIYLAAWETTTYGDKSPNLHTVKAKDVTVGNADAVNGYKVVIGSVGTDTNTLYCI